MTFQDHPAKMKVFFSDNYIPDYISDLMLTRAFAAVEIRDPIPRQLLLEDRLNGYVRNYIDNGQIGDWLRAHDAEHQIDCQLFGYQSDYRLVVYVTLFDEVLASAFCMTWC